ncbi:MAG: aquaporin, partial [Beijerinckiaceae bacterium]
TLPTGAILVVLITIFGPVSGAHFNPAVSLVMAARGLLARSDVLPFVAAQCFGAIAGTLMAHAMFGLPLVSAFTRPRTGLSLWLAEMVAAFGLVAVIFGALRARAEAVAWIVGLYITAAYWFTASTSYANPAVTLGRAFTSSFAGIRVVDVPGFVVAQLIGAALAAALAGWLFADARKN